MKPSVLPLYLFTCEMVYTDFDRLFYGAICNFNLQWILLQLDFFYASEPLEN